jgi:hypothetical protein
VAWPQYVCRRARGRRVEKRPGGSYPLTSSSTGVACLDHPLRYDSQFCVGVRRETGEEREGSGVRHLVPVHGDTDGLSDDLPGLHSLLQLSDVPGVPDGDGSLVAEQFTEVRKVLERIGVRGVEVQCPVGVFGVEEAQTGLRPDSGLTAMGAYPGQRPPRARSDAVMCTVSTAAS